MWAIHFLAACCARQESSAPVELVSPCGGRSWGSSHSHSFSTQVFRGRKAAFEEAPIAAVSVEVGFRGMSYEHRARQLGGCIAPGRWGSEVGSKEVVSASDVLAASLGIGNAGASYVSSQGGSRPGSGASPRHLRKGLMRFPPSELSWV